MSNESSTGNEGAFPILTYFVVSFNRLTKSTSEMLRAWQSDAVQPRRYDARPARTY